MGRPEPRAVLVLIAALIGAACVVLPASAYWSGSSAANGQGAAAATSVNAGTTPGVSVNGGSVSVSWSASTLASGAAVAGYEVDRYDVATSSQQTVTGACAGTVTALSCTEPGVPDGSWRYTVTPVVGQNWRGAESAKSAPVLVDTTAPTSSLSLNVTSGNATLSGTTIYYRGSAAGTFTITNTVTDAASGPASSETTSLGGTATGWSHAPSTVTSPSGGPYVSPAFSWTAGTTSSPTEVINTRDARGNVTTTTLTLAEDSNAPTGTVTYVDGYTAGRNVAVSYTTGGGATSAQLQRARATLKNDTCGTFGTFANVGPNNPAPPYSDGPNLAGVCLKYRLLASDALGNTATITSTSVAKVGYAGAVRATAGLLSYWRFGENADTASDTFSGLAGVALQDRDGDTGATWTRHPTATADMVLTAAGRARKDGTSGIALDLASGVPTSADYRVEATLVSQTIVATDRACVVGRSDASTATYYSACYEQASSSWTLNSVSTGTVTQLATATAAFPAASTRRVALDLSGSTIRLLVDGTQLLSVTSTTITSAGRGGLLQGPTTSTNTVTDTTGLHLDDFRIGPVDSVPAAADQRGVNSGAYLNGPALGQLGVLAGDTDTAARFDGVDDYMQVPSTSQLPTGASARSVELWFKTTASTRQVLFGYGSRNSTQEFALWLNSGGTSMTAWGFGTGNDKTYTLTNAVNDGSWHHVVQTYNGTTLTLYLDGSTVGSQNATRNTAVDSYGLGIGAIVTPGDANSGGYFTGSLDEVAIYTTTLTPATVADHYGLARPSDDLDGPTGGSVDGANLVGTGSRWRNTTSLSLSFAKGTDPSGLAATGAVLQRAQATVTTSTNGTCGAFGTYSVVGNDPVSPLAQTVSNGYCYRYRYLVSDALGNTTTYASPTIKTDTSAPGTPTATYTGLSNTYATSGYVVYYRSTAPGGSITLTAASSDTGSGIAGYTLPTLGAGWTSTPGATSAVNTYSWSAAGPAAPGAKPITSANNAALTSATRTVTFTADDTAPTGGAISYTDGKTTATTVPITLTLGTDSQSGLATTKVIQASTASAAGGVCGTFGAFTQVATTTTATTSAPALAQDTCAMYRFVVTDRVGNVATYTNPNIVRRTAVYATTVTSTSGATDFWRLGEASGATTAVDGVGANNPGTYQGTPTLGVSGAIVGDTNTAATFDGSSQYVSMARNLTTNLSIELWFKSTQTNGGSGAQWYNAAALIDADVTGAANDFGVGLASDGRVVAGVGTAGGSDVSIRSAAGLNDGTWHHVVFTRASTGPLVLYVDGASVASATGGTNALTGSSTMTLARGNAGGNFYAGSLDEVSTYTSVLTASQVAARYNAAK